MALVASNTVRERIILKMTTMTAKMIFEILVADLH